MEEQLDSEVATMPTKPKVVMIPLAQITNRFDVRTKLDEDRVLQLMGCYEAGQELPPIEVVQFADDGYAYVDGRHRGAARAYCNFTDIAAIVIDNPNDPAELFARALEANYGGSKPPTRDDITHTVVRMLELGATQTAIRERLQFLPVGALKAYIASARGSIMKRKIAKAMDDIGDGLTIDTVAARYRIPLDSLKDVVKGKKGKWGKGRSTEAELAIAFKSYISTELRAANSGISKKMEFMLQKVDAGEMSYKAAKGVIHAWSEHLRKTGIRVMDWNARLDAIAGETTKAVETAEPVAAVE
jgi:hypothetical protein